MGLADTTKADLANDIQSTIDVICDKYGFSKRRVVEGLEAMSKPDLEYLQMFFDDVWREIRL